MTFYGILLLYISVVVLSFGYMVIRLAGYPHVDKRTYFECLRSSMVIGIIAVAGIIIGSAVAKLFEIITMGIK